MPEYSFGLHSAEWWTSVVECLFQIRGASAFSHSSLSPQYRRATAEPIPGRIGLPAIDEVDHGQGWGMKQSVGGGRVRTLVSQMAPVPHIRIREPWLWPLRRYLGHRRAGRRDIGNTDTGAVRLDLGGLLVPSRTSRLSRPAIHP